MSPMWTPSRSRPNCFSISSKAGDTEAALWQPDGSTVGSVTSWEAEAGSPVGSSPAPTGDGLDMSAVGSGLSIDGDVVLSVGEPVSNSGFCRESTTIKSPDRDGRVHGRQAITSYTGWNRQSITHNPSRTDKTIKRRLSTVQNLLSPPDLSRPLNVVQQKTRDDTHHTRVSRPTKWPLTDKRFTGH